MSLPNEILQQIAEQTGRPNNGYALTTQSTALSRRPKPLVAEHQSLMRQLPATLSSTHRSAVSRFLCHLELLLPPQNWSALAPAAAGELRPAALEAVVNTGIAQNELISLTRAAINRVFNLMLQAPSGRVKMKPMWGEHQALMGQLPTTLAWQHRSAISRFLCHIERQLQSWSALAPAGELRPAALEDAVSTVITQHGLNVGTRAAINLAFHLALQAPSGRIRLAPTSEEHQALMGQLPTTLSAQQRSSISRFLCHLELLIPPQSWSTLAPAGVLHPAELEAAVNKAITQRRLQIGTRLAINRAFNLALKGPSGRQI